LVILHLLIALLVQEVDIARVLDLLLLQALVQVVIFVLLEILFLDLKLNFVKEDKDAHHKALQLQIVQEIIKKEHIRGFAKHAPQVITVLQTLENLMKKLHVTLLLELLTISNLTIAQIMS